MFDFSDIFLLIHMSSLIFKGQEGSKNTILGDVKK